MNSHHSKGFMQKLANQLPGNVFSSSTVIKHMLHAHAYKLNGDSSSGFDDPTGPIIILRFCNCMMSADLESKPFSTQVTSVLPLCNV